MDITDVGVYSALDAIVLTSNANGNVVDLTGFTSLVFAINVGAFTFSGTNNITVTVQESDAGDGSGMATVAAGDYVWARTEAGAVWDRLLNATGEDNQAYMLAVRNTKRYQRIVFTVAGAVSVPIAVTAVLLGAWYRGGQL